MSAEQCEAIMFCRDPKDNRAGQRCINPGHHDFYGHPVCWVHLQAAWNNNRAAPLRFVRSRASKPVAVDVGK
jgi:hypothetical protein